MIRGRPGGKRRPRVPEVVSKPREKFSEYRPRIMAGSRIPPRAMLVSPVAQAAQVDRLAAELNSALTELLA